MQIWKTKNKMVLEVGDGIWTLYLLDDGNILIRVEMENNRTETFLSIVGTLLDVLVSF